jgi:mono/diheme cytochrome c family protein
MRYKNIWAAAGVGALLLLTGCGGGGAGTSTSGDTQFAAPQEDAPATGLDRFLLFPNPQLRTNGVFEGVFEVGSPEYAKAYYEAIDPNNTKDTLAKWKAANNIGVTGAGHAEHTVTFGDMRDLGYGRSMTAHQNPDGSMAFVVQNYQVGEYGSYTPLNLEAAVNLVPQWHIGTNAIEFSPGPGAGVGGRPSDAKFVKFFSFDPVTGARLLVGSLDGRPDKAMPTICITCHGGRGDPLTPPDASGKKLFALVANAYSQQRGDVQAKLQPLEPATFDYSTAAGFTRADLEPGIKAINKMVLCSYPRPGNAAFPEDECRRPATFNEYQGTAAASIKHLYGGDGLPNATSPATDTYIEASWVAAGQSTLFQTVQAPACQVCHRLLGTANNPEISFQTFAHFDAFKDRTKIHVVDRGNMPLAKLIYDKFQSTASMLQAMATYLVSAGFADGALTPGRPIADPGPDRLVLPGSTQLSAAMSLYADKYQWSLVSNPGGSAALSNRDSLEPTFTASAAGTYQVQLVVSNATGASAPARLTVEVKGTVLDGLGQPYKPAELRFADIKRAIGVGATGGCTGCHVPPQPGGTSLRGASIPPVWFTDYDRSGTGNTTTNDNWFHAELRGLINFTDIVASPLLRKPAGNHHGGGARAGFDTRRPVGDPGRADYDKLVNWISIGAPQ